MVAGEHADDLLRVAWSVREHAYAPASGFRVGAAVRAADGRVFVGCNVENASYGLTVCAERNAIGRMVLEGKKLRAVAIVVHSQKPTPPCGMCRQVLAEFGDPSIEVRSRNNSGMESKDTIGSLLPNAFTKDFL